MGKLFRNKGIVTIVAIAICLAILFFAYRYRVNKAINAVSVPIATKTLEARKLIEEDDIKTVKVAYSMITNNVILNKENIIGKYVNYNTFIPEGSLFYDSAVVTWSSMPDSTWSDIPEGHTIVSLSVNSQSTYGNSIYPGDKIDLYYQGSMGENRFVGKLIEGITVLAVKDERGNHIFKKSAEQTNAAALIFSVPENMHLLLRKAIYLNGYVIPVPRNAEYNADTSIYRENTNRIVEYINSLSHNLTPETDVKGIEEITITD